MEKMVQQYIDSYNDRWGAFKHVPNKPKSFRDIEFGRQMHYRVTPLERRDGKEDAGFLMNILKPDRHQRLKGDQHKQETEEGNVLKVRIPVLVTPREGYYPTHLMSMRTAFEVTLREYNVPSSYTAEKVVPQLKLEVTKELVVDEFSCVNADEELCADLKQDLVENLAHTILNFESTDYWDSPSAFRFLQGWVRAANEFALRDMADSLHLHLDNEAENLQFFANCPEESLT